MDKLNRANRCDLASLLELTTSVLEGELLMLTPNGRSDFADFERSFDLLELDGEDLRDRPLQT
jgi:ATP-dependent DNA ligase